MPTSPMQTDPSQPGPMLSTRVRAFLRRTLARLRNLRPSARADQELDREIAAHLALLEEDYQRRGLSPADAHTAARRTLGGVEQTRQAYRDQRSFLWVEYRLQDLRFALRQLSRNPGYAGVAILTLALGIGANTAIFLLTYSILLRGLPVPDPSQLIRYTFRKGDSELGLSYRQYQALEQQQRVATGLFAWDMSGDTVERDGQPGKVSIAMTTGSAFRVLDLRPALGRGLEPSAGEPGAPYVPEALLFWDYWHTAFHGDPSVIGQTLHLKGVAAAGGASVSIVGVLPRGFTGVQAGHAPDLLLPLSFDRVLHRNAMIDNPSGSYWLIVMGRLRPGATVLQAQASLAAMRRSINEAADPSHRFLNGGFFSSYQLGVESGRTGESFLRFRFSRPLLALEALCGLMMLLCGINIALLVLSRVSGRLHEFAMRTALGASRRRLIFQVLTETLLLGAGGLLAGLALGWQLARWLVTLINNPGEPTSLHLGLSAVVVFFAAAISLGATLLAGLWPAWRASRHQAAHDLRQMGSGRSPGHIGRWILPAQVALGVVFLYAALLLAGTLEAYLHEHSGFAADTAVLAELDLSNAGAPPSGQPQRSFDFLHRVQAMPGVGSAALMALPPVSGGFAVSDYFTRDAQGTLHVNEQVWPQQVSSGYFRTMGTRILEGHSFTAADLSGDSTCLLSAGAAAYFFPGQSALGRFLNSGNGAAGSKDPERCRVIGIAEDARLASLLQPAPLAVYLPLEAEKEPLTFLNIAVRAATPQMATTAIREAAAAVFPGAPQPRTWLFRDAINQNLSQQRLLSGVSGGFALLALALVATGLYGILARAVIDRRREIGIRMALGAQRREIVRTLARSAIFRIALGVLAGAGLAFLTGRLLQSLLYGVSAASPGIATATLALLLAVLTLAFLVPAARAASIDPMEAIRDE